MAVRNLLRREVSAGSVCCQGVVPALVPVPPVMAAYTVKGLSGPARMSVCVFGDMMMMSSVSNPSYSQIL